MLHVGNRKTQQVRIIAGQYKGRRLAYPGSGVFRPTMARTREALFSVLHGRVAGRAFVDLFSAAGGIGIEALSRGAQTAHFVERDRLALDLLRRNLDSCGVDGSRYSIHAEDVFGYLERGQLESIGDAIVFADPPYGGDDASGLAAHLRETEYNNVIVLILEHRDPIDAADLGALALWKTRKFGDTSLTFWLRAQ
jgi:16S rRNA (guanine966-N2)-methyltransferase